VEGQSIEERRAALKERVQAQLKSSEEAKLSRELAAENELVIESDAIDLAVEQAAERLQAKIDALEDSDRNRLRTLAASLILIGSILGLASGALILNGNPGDLLASSWFDDSERVDVTGLALEAEEGTGVSNVTVQLLDIDTDEVIAELVTTSNGYFRFADILTNPVTLRVEATGYVTVERDFIPEEAGIDPVTMTPGEGIRYEGNVDSKDGWELELAVGLSTAVGIVTVLTALVGFQAAVEVRRAKHYRRTQYLAGISLFSRGMILFGPALILLGMILLVVTKEQFLDTGGE
tara:strand:- start:4253 stop:5131 length:879 start_codon:yes stop_codon:yes gene_type:complete